MTEEVIQAGRFSLSKRTVGIVTSIQVAFTGGEMLVPIPQERTTEWILDTVARSAVYHRLPWKEVQLIATAIEKHF